jgi:hypothetical protein
MSEPQAGSKPAPPDPSTDIDLYCLYCGYNLRGLSGDPRRCPECGKLNPVGDLVVPAEAISFQLRRMETWPTLCVASSLLILIFSPFQVTALFSLAGGSDKALCSMTVLLVALAIWTIGAFKFRSACMARPGWLSVLVEYHAWGIGLTALLAAVFGMSCWLSETVPWEYQDRRPVVFLVALGALATVFLLAFWVRRRCRARMYPLQREVATTIARDYLRRDMVQPQA